MAEGHTGLAISDALTDLILPALGFRMFMRHGKDGPDDPTISSQDELLLLQAVESLKVDNTNLRDFIVGYFRYLKKTNRTRSLPRLREVISRAAGKDGTKSDSVKKLLTDIFESELKKVAATVGSDLTSIDEVYERLSSELDLILTQRLQANFSDRLKTVTDWLSGLDDEGVEAGEDFERFMRERKAKRNAD